MPGDDDTSTKYKVNKDEISTNTEHLKDQDNLHAISTKYKEIEQYQPRSGNINHLLSKAHGKV